MGDSESKVQGEQNKNGQNPEHHAVYEDKNSEMPETQPSYKINRKKNLSELTGSIRSSMPEEEEYLLQPIQTITLKEQKKFSYFWLDTNVYNEENEKYGMYLKQKGIEVRQFASMPALEDQMRNLHPKKKLKIICAASLSQNYYKRFQNSPKINEVFLFCQSKEKAKSLMMSFPVIKHPTFQIQDLKNAILQAERFDSQVNQKSSILFMIPEDINTLNKYRLNYHCVTLDFSREAAKKDLITFAKSIYPEQDMALQMFEKNYKIELPQKERIKQTLEWLVMDNFFWKTTQELPQSSYLPKQLAYSRLLFKDIEEAIAVSYKKQPNKIIKQAYIVMIISQFEKEKLKKNKDNYLAFTSFCKGYSDEKYAMGDHKRNKDTTLFKIMLQTTALDENYDYGYWVDTDKQRSDEKNVYFNLYNLFKVEEVNGRQVILHYGGLADVSSRYKNKRQMKKMSKEDKNLIINCEYLEDKKNQILCQNDLIKLFNLKEAEQNQLRRTEILRKSNPSNDVMEYQRIQMGDLYFLNEEYSKAEKEYESVIEPNVRKLACIYLAKLYLKTGEYDKFEKIQKEIKAAIEYLKPLNPNKAGEGMLYLGFNKMRKNKKKEAKKKFYEAIQFLAEKSTIIESNTVIHDLYQALGVCHSESGSLVQSKNMLETVKKWKEYCEGNNSSSLLQTQHQLQNIYQKQNDTMLLGESRAKYNQIIREVPPGEHYYKESNTIDLDRIQLQQSKCQVQVEEDEEEESFPIKCTLVKIEDF